MKYLATENIPSYAVCALEYGDYSGLDRDDEQDIKEFLTSYSEQAPHGLHFEWQFAYEDFSRCPAFGLPSQCVTAHIFAL